MGRRTSLVALLVVGTGLVIAGHALLWARLVQDVGLSPAIERALSWTLVGLAASIPVGVITSRLVPPRWARWWIVPVYYWIGAATLLLCSVVTVDLLCVALGPVPAHARASTALVLGVGASIVAAIEGRVVRIVRVEVVLHKLPSALDGLRIVQISDLHIGPTLGRRFVERTVATVDGLAPDIVAITGDLVDASVRDIGYDVAPLARLTPRYGTYFVTGNHEYHAGADAWCEHLGTLGIHVLRNASVVIEHGGHVLHVAGVDDDEAARDGGGSDLDAAIAGCDPRRALVLLAHQPRAIHDAVRRGVDLQLSGHTHGGQLWPVAWLMRLGQPLVAGLARFGETSLYVSCGTGHSGPPMRLGAPAEITELVLRSRACGPTRGGR